MKHKITRRIAELDPERDCQEIVYLLQSYEFPWDYEHALEFALFRTYAVPAISRLLLRWFPERRKPRLGTQVKRPTYPEGYRIEELGTFGK